VVRVLLAEIQWPDIGMDLVLSSKDQNAQRLLDAEVF
jgi:hypothetical protein